MDIFEGVAMLCYQVSGCNIHKKSSLLPSFADHIMSFWLQEDIIGVSSAQLSGHRSCRAMTWTYLKTWLKYEFAAFDFFLNEENG